VTQVYYHPDGYDLQHLGDEEDIAFYLGLVRRLLPVATENLESSEKAGGLTGQSVMSPACSH
jgi:hypothetical protein